MTLYYTDSYHYTNVAADFAEQERRVAQPESGYIYGPYQPFTEEEVVDLEVNTFGAVLNDFEKVLLEGMHQYTVRGEAYRVIGEHVVADLFEAVAENTFNRIKKAVDSPNPERIYLSNKG